MTTEQPAANAGATFLVIIAAGKFHGVMIPHTPMGCFTVITVVFGIDEGITSPYDLGASSANQEMKLAAYTISLTASAKVLPFSRHRIVATI